MTSPKKLSCKCEQPVFPVILLSQTPLKCCENNIFIAYKCYENNSLVTCLAIYKDKRTTNITFNS